MRAALIADESPLRLVITLRADFTDRPLHYVEFGELMRQRTEFVLPLSADELERAIAEPARRVGLQIDPDQIAKSLQLVLEATITGSEDGVAEARIRACDFPTRRTSEIGASN